MKQSLQLKIGQHLAMTPQLQQAIRLLQLSSLELQAEVQEALESNAMLEVDEEHDIPAAANDLSTENLVDETTISASRETTLEQPSQADSPPESQETGTHGDAEVNIDGNEIPSELAVDADWDSIYTNSSSPISQDQGPASDFDIDSRNTTKETLQDHLNWQLNLTQLSDIDRAIGVEIVDAVGPDGMLTLSLEEIFESLSRSLAPYDLEFDEVQAVLHRIQQFDPLGVAALDLQDALMIQLKALPRTDSVRAALRIVHKHLNLLAAQDLKALKRRTRLKESEITEAILIIQSLNPRPGEQLSNSEAEYIVPDVYVSKTEGRWLVELNGESAPKLRINQDYASLIKRADTSSTNTYLRDNLQEAKWFLKSLQSRNETLMKVATKIVELQQQFLEIGAEGMKPMVLHDIAEAVGMHESTISRVTTHKYMHTPQGVFELKYFFSSHVGTEGGGECSSTAIRAMIQKLVNSEDAKKPLSDNKIANLLADQGIKVARRTIAKYRESIGIPSSSDRKRVI